MINYIQELVDNGYAYTIDGDCYFRTSKIEEYGVLSKVKLDEIADTSRIDENENPILHKEKIVLHT